MAYLISRPRKGHNYWSIVESKRINGKPRQIQVEYIGSDEKLKKFVTELYNKQNNEGGNLNFSAYIHGAPYALWKVATMLGIPELIDEIFPSKTRNGIKRSTSLLLGSIHRACSPGSKNSFSNWLSKTSLPYHLSINEKVMTSQHFWEQMDGITQEELERIQDAILKKIIEKYPQNFDFLALDYTNYFTFIDSENTKNTICKRGHNKQKRTDLRQFSLAAVTCKELSLPMLTHVYEGNKNDRYEFATFVEIIEKRIISLGLKCENITLTFDGGSNTKENINNLKFHFICSFSMASAKELYDIDINEYQEIQLENKTIKAYTLEYDIWGVNRKCILTLSEDLYKGRCTQLEKDIVKFKQQIEILKDKLKNPKSKIYKESSDKIKERLEKILDVKYLKDFITLETQDKIITYQIDEDKKNKLMEKYFGKKLTITDHLDWSTEKIMSAYYDQECIEKVFRDTKDVNHFCMQPIYHWTDQKIYVHVFICLLAQQLGQILKIELENNDIKISKDVMLNELMVIYDGWVINNSNKSKTSLKRVIGTMNELQSKMWNVIDKI